MAKRNKTTAKQLNENSQIHKDGTIEWWRDVPNYQGLYRVSDRGRVKSLDKVCRGRSNGMRLVPGRMLKFGVEKTGHLHVSLCKPGQQNTFKVSILVLMAFCRMPKRIKTKDSRSSGFAWEYALHTKDPDPTNNNLSNLRWGTPTDNVKDISRHHGKHHSAKVTDKQRRKIIKMLKSGKFSNDEISKMYPQLSPGAISWIKKQYTNLPDGRRFSRRPDRRKQLDPWGDEEE
jgi:hypothetical protein